MSMQISFSKYQGAGNDFIIIDNRDKLLDKTGSKTIRSLCDRRFGIGADGLILLENDKDYDFRMVYFNADGHEGTMCGNGGRCMVAFAYHKKLIGSSTRFIAIDGPHEATLLDTRESDAVISLQMTHVDGIRLIKGGYFLDTGSPHLVVFGEDIDNINVKELGSQLRYDPVFEPGGTNVNFVEVNSEGGLIIRTYERGVEDETLACGTGVTAAAIAAWFSERITATKNINVRAKGGKLKVAFTPNGNDRFSMVFLEGPATKVFDGHIDI